MAHLTLRGRALRRRSTLPLLSLALALGVLSGAEARPPAEPAPGAAGIGDPYFPVDGNGGIDVRHYDVHDRYVFGSGRLTGRTEMTVRATQDLSRFNLDFLLGVRDVRIDGAPATHSRPRRHELQITPADPIASGETFEVVVRYGGRPGPISYVGEKNWVAGPNEVIAVNEPHMAPWWFPSNDHPLDKARFDIRITTGDQKRVVSNGSLVSRVERRGLATTHWRSPEPMTTYLAFFTAGDFAVEHGKRHGLPWYIAVSRALSPQTRQTSMRSLRRSPALTEWLADELGPYPFSSTGGLVTGLPLGFALENQTRPVYPSLGPRSNSLLVHELAHQWFGDSVAVDGWRDIWLNEGFATYMEVRHVESQSDRSTVTWLENNYRYRRGDDGFWTLQIDDPGPDRIFAYAVYLRGGMTLAALRERIGGRDFGRLLRTWVADNAGGNVTTSEFEALAETASGEDLEGFFDAWLRGDAPPEPTADNGLSGI